MLKIGRPATGRDRDRSRFSHQRSCYCSGNAELAGSWLLAEWPAGQGEPLGARGGTTAAPAPGTTPFVSAREDTGISRSRNGAAGVVGRLLEGGRCERDGTRIHSPSWTWSRSNAVAPSPRARSRAFSRRSYQGSGLDSDWTKGGAVFRSQRQRSAVNSSQLQRSARSPL
jgi:hypothetical protein